ncbi:MAG: hypothetical protein J1F13_05285 [Prevotellaceae bacterium]|nr:hypothetical protein [Prevotellaceae bacterium]
MKILGIVFLVFAGLNLIVAIVCATSEVDGSVVAQKFFAGLMLGVLGAFLVSRANKKKKEVEEKHKWEEKK